MPSLRYKYSTIKLKDFDNHSAVNKLEIVKWYVVDNGKKTEDEWEDMLDSEKIKFQTEFEKSIKLIEDDELSKSLEIKKILISGECQYNKPSKECIKTDGTTISNTENSSTQVVKNKDGDYPKCGNCGLYTGENISPMFGGKKSRRKTRRSKKSHRKSSKKSHRKSRRGGKSRRGRR